MGAWSARVRACSPETESVQHPALRPTSDFRLPTSDLRSHMQILNPFTYVRPVRTATRLSHLLGRQMIELLSAVG